MLGRTVIFATSMCVLALESKFCRYSFPIGSHFHSNGYLRQMAVIVENNLSWWSSQEHLYFGRYCNPDFCRH